MIPLDRTPDPLAGLRQELASLSIDPEKALKTLPDWWQDAVEHPSGITEIRSFLAKHFGLAFGSEGQLCPRSLAPCYFRTSRRTNTADLNPARAFATSVARLLAHATPRPWIGKLPTAAELRCSLLCGPDPQYIGLDKLLEACWAVGIPVAYLPEFPIFAPTMDGMVTSCDGRPVVIISQEACNVPWMMFVLAHEIGHIACGHLSVTDSIIDEVVSEDEPGADKQENEANAYARELLTGSPKHSGFFVKPIPGGKVASILPKEALRNNIDTDLLPDSSVQFLENIGLL